MTAVFLGLSGSSASAHNTFVDSSPANGQVLAVAPANWSVTFASDVPLDSASGEIVRSDGSRASLASPTHGQTTTTVVFALPSDLTGSVTARWRLVGTDGHVISGRVTFSIGAPTETGPGNDNTSNSVTPTDGDDSTGLPAPAQTTLRLLNYIALLAVGGLFAAESHFARGSLSSPVAGHTVLYGAGVLAVIPVVQILQLAADISASSLFGALTRWGDALSILPGQMTALRAVFGAIVAAVAFGSLRGRSDERLPFIAAGASAGYLVTLAYSGHARSQGSPWLGIPVDVVHTAAVTYWLGGVAVLLVVVAPMLDTTSALAAYRRFGSGARLAVPVIIGTGVIQTARLHGGVVSLFSSTHGRVLLVKIAVVAAMLKVADRNRRLLSASSQAVNERRLRRDITATALAETGIGLVVVAVTAVLVTSSLA